MAAKKKSDNGSDVPPPSASMEGTPPELIIVTKPQTGLRAAPSGLTSVSGANVRSLNSLLESNNATIVPVFGSEERVARAVSSAPPELWEQTFELTNFYKVEAPESKLEKIAEKLLNEDLVEGAYVQPPAFPPVIDVEPKAAAEEAPPATADFTSRQIYLNAAPAGIDARFAWTRPGGKGQGVRIIDIEGAWRFSHEDLLQNQGGVIGGTQSTEIRWRNHGTAVVGVFGGDENTFGITGICPLANTRAISIFGSGQSTAKAITDAANALSPGDIILIELHAPGPRFNFQEVSPNNQQGFIAMEFWAANFAAIVYATSVRGVIVVEAAGNGSENYDDPLYNNRPAGFPASWRNPFNLANPQSGAIIVGAGAPPPGTHGRDHGPDRSRLAFSNFGARVDVQGWGREVTTAAYGSLQGGSNENLWYTDTFDGTSSASPVVVGAIGCMQGGLRGKNKPLLTPATARNILRTTGSPQQDAPGRPATQRIGNRPNLRQAFNTLGIGKGVLKDTVKDHNKEIIKEKDIKEVKDTQKDIKDKEKDKEIKEKDIKDVIKDVKEKEFKEGKETKDVKEGKEVKEGAKEIKDSHEGGGKIRDVINPPPTSGGMEERMAQLEESVAQLTHFIAQSLRPDLQTSALYQEEDMTMLNQQLEKEATDAKAAKDQKDIEKVREV
jgi:hypothetical protein